MHLVHDGMHEPTNTRASVSANQTCFVLRELHLMKGPDIEAIFSVEWSIDIVKKHNVTKRVGHVFRSVWLAQTGQTFPGI